MFENFHFEFSTTYWNSRTEKLKDMETDLSKNNSSNVSRKRNADNMFSEWMLTDFFQ